MNLNWVVLSGVKMTSWAILIWIFLQSSRLVSASEHSFCGPWGCGPSADSLVAMHMGWLAFMGPPLIYLSMHRNLSSTLA